MHYKSFHRYRYVCRQRVDKPCLVSTSSPESLLYQFFTNDDGCHRYHPVVTIWRVCFAGYRCSVFEMLLPSFVFLRVLRGKKNALPSFAFPRLLSPVSCRFSKSLALFSTSLDLDQSQVFSCRVESTHQQGSLIRRTRVPPPGTIPANTQKEKK